MPFINLPPVLSEMMWDLESRVRRLETAYRFNAPNVNFNTSTPTNPRVGDIFYDTYANFLKYWNGSAWVEIADNNLSTTITTLPTTMQSTNNNMVYTGNPVTLEMQRIGKMITANAEINFTNVTNFGTGQYYINIPAGIPNRAHDLAAGGYLTKAGVVYTIFGTLGATDNKMYLWHPTSNGSSDIVSYNKPTTITTATQIQITGVALLA